MVEGRVEKARLNTKGRGQGGRHGSEPPPNATADTCRERAGERIVRPQSTRYNALLNPLSPAQSRASREARARAWRCGQGRGKRPNERTR